MRDPVVAADGYTYERAAILQLGWLAAMRGEVPRSPTTGLPMPSAALLPNQAIADMLAEGQ